MMDIFHHAGVTAFILYFIVILTTAIIIYKFYYFHLFAIHRENRVIKEVSEKIKGFKIENMGMKKNELYVLIETELSHEKKQFDRYLPTLATISSISTLLGLLGTVVGMITATRGIVEIDNTTLLRGVSEALITTVIGIVIAIPAVIFYNFFVGKIDRLLEDMKERIFSLLIE